MAHKNALVVGVEGLSGCGKTTVIGLLTRALGAVGIAAIAVDIDTAAHAPTLRKIADTLPLDNFVRSMLFWAMRVRQYEKIQELRAGVDVILMDRTFGTAYAVDGYGNGIAQEWLKYIGQRLQPPDMTFLFQVPVAVALARKKSRTMRDMAFARRIEHGYAKLARIYGWLCVDATRTPEETAEQCLKIIRRALKKKRCVS